MPDKTFWIMDRIKMACAILAIIIVAGGQVIIAKRILGSPAASAGQAEHPETRNRP